MVNLFTISWSYIQNKKLNTLLNSLLLAMGVSIVVFLLLVQYQLNEKFTNNVKGIKMVVGAKGSPLQLILCNVYHIDNPTGNIPLLQAVKIIQNRRFVKKSIPLALGDSYEGFRIVGTTHEYAQHYKAQIQTGKLWQKTMEATIGAEVAQKLKLKIGSTFAGAHGEIKHEEAAYKVVGILKPNNSVLDRLILANIESVWALHEEHTEEDSTHQDHEIETYQEALQDTATSRAITALLITEYTNPIAAINLPRMVNGIDILQAASPALEINNLFLLLGIGEQAIQIFAWIIIFIAILSIFIALFNALKERKYDLAMMRTLGASRFKLFSQIILEGTILAALGGSLGFLLGHSLVHYIGSLEVVAERFYLTGLLFLQDEIWLIFLIFSVGLIASLIPAFQVYRMDISKVLAKES